MLAKRQSIIIRWDAAVLTYYYQLSMVIKKKILFVYIRLIIAIGIWRFISNRHIRSNNTFMGICVYAGYALRTDRSTEDAVSTALHSVFTGRENKKSYSRVLFVDFSPTKFIWKTEHLSGLECYTLQLNIGFLTYRPQTVQKIKAYRHIIAIPADYRAASFPRLTTLFHSLLHTLIHFLNSFALMLMLLYCFFFSYVARRSSINCEMTNKSTLIPWILCACKHTQDAFAVRGSFPKLNADQFTLFFMIMSKTASL